MVLKRWQFLLLTALAVVSLALVCTNIVLLRENSTAQAEYNSRAQYIQQSQQIEPLYQSIVRSVAEVAANTNDQQLGQVLTSQGINFSLSQSAKPATEAAKDGKDKKSK